MEEFNHSYFACIFIRSTQILTSDIVASLAEFGWRKAQLRDPERLCVERLRDTNFPRVIGTKPPYENELRAHCLSSADTFLPSPSQHPLTKA